MNRKQFLTHLDDLINEAKRSDDAVVVQSSGVLYALKGSILAGEDYFETLTDNVVNVAKAQRELLKSVS